MAEFTKTLILKDEMEANLLDSILNEKMIPHLVRSYHDSALDGLFQMSKGWGVLLAPKKYQKEILQIHEDINTKSK
jgi:hypothetical protein